MGRTLYFGPALTAVGFFCKNYNYKFDENRNGANPAEFVVAVAGGYEQPKLSPEVLAERFSESQLNTKFHSYYHSRLTEDFKLEAAQNRKKGSTYPSSILAQCGTLGSRQIMKTAQNTRPLVAGFIR